MPDKIQRITSLILKQLNGSLSDPEEQELDEWLALSEDRRNWYEEVMRNKFYLPRKFKEYMEVDAIRRTGWDKIGVTRTGVYPIRKYSIGRWAAVAAAVIILFSAGIIYWMTGRQKEAAVAPSVVKKYNNDVPPGGNKATLTLGNGTRLVLNDAENGAIAQQGETTVLKLDSGQVAYNSSQNKSAQTTTGVMWNTISTPKGGQYRIVLPDGSKVWLNAASSLRFPTSFSDNSREVILTGGEAYFEIASQTSKGKHGKTPFIVKINTPSGEQGEVEVLGTHFDVMAYEDEKNIKTTLLEGKIKMKSRTTVQVLAPGQQAQVDADGTLHVADEPDAEGAIAWTNGLFRFDREDIGAVMRQLGRWYDVEIVYEGKKTSHSFSGVISRDNNASDVLKALEVSDVHFKIEGNKIIVLP